jgi:transcriptional regulator with XRE-family HTH domain
MDVSQLIQQKLTALGLDQRDLADAAEVTESYISQLLSRKKMPPAPERTDIYDKLGRVLKLPADKLAGLGDLQRKQELRRKIQSPPGPLFREVRELLFQKCKAPKRSQIRARLSRRWYRWRSALVIVKPDTLSTGIVAVSVGTGPGKFDMEKLDGRVFRRKHPN